MDYELGFAFFIIGILYFLVLNPIFIAFTGPRYTTYSERVTMAIGAHVGLFCVYWILKLIWWSIVTTWLYFSQ